MRSQPREAVTQISPTQGRTWGTGLYEDWEQQALADLANQAASPQNCQTRILTAVNAQFGTSFTSDSNVGTGPDAPFQYSTGAPQGGGTLNIDIFPGTGQGGGISPGRYPVNWWTYIIGVGSTLHIPSGPSGTESSSTLVFSSNGFTAHLDSAYPYNPIGFIAHVLADMTGLGGYKLCP